jgi:hypothetical protein
MAVDKDIAAAVLDEIGDGHVVIIDIVQDELTRRDPQGCADAA